jgi:hypothetical protein
MQNWDAFSRPTKGSMRHMPQWSEGNCTSSLERMPPMAGDRSVSSTSCPDSARSSAARIPATPAPTTRALAIGSSITSPVR